VAPVRLVAQAVVTVDGSGRVLRPGAVEFDGGRITWVGPAEEPRPGPAQVEEVGGLLMPGLVNAHGHSPMTLVRSAGDGLPLSRWLAEVVWPREGAMTDEDAYWGMLAGALELLGNGVTTSAEMYAHPGAVARAAAEAGIRMALAPAIFDFPGPDGGWRAHLDRALAARAEYHGAGNGRISVGLGPHAAYTLGPEALAGVAAAADDTGALVQIHLAETRAEAAAVAERHQSTAVQALDRAGLLHPRLLAAHVVWLDPAETALLAERGVAVAHCPQSNGKLGSGVAPLPALRAAGLRVGLGTDGPASNDGLDLREAARVAALLARATAADPGALTTAAALSLATAGGADALGLEAGRLEAGRLADVVRLDLDDLRFVPAADDHELVAHLVWAARSAQVTDVWVGGERILRRGCWERGEAAEVRRQAAARGRRLASAG
jgi:5-methylthioadenosine/S-adenosylhomocysteine deaminase